MAHFQTSEVDEKFSPFSMQLRTFKSGNHGNHDILVQQLSPYLNALFIPPSSFSNIVFLFQEVLLYLDMTST
jgi:hypothetical protein